MSKKTKIWSIALASGFALLFGGCKTGEVEREKAAARAAKEAEPRDTVVAKVDGAPIYASEVTALIRAAKTPLAPKEALDILIRNALLVNEARRRGLAGATEMGDMRKTELARLFLEKEIGQKITASSLDDRMLKAGYDMQKERFVHGKLRRTDHILARTGKGFLSDEEARKLADRAAALAAKIKNEEEFLAVGRALVAEWKDKVRVEKLPAFAENTTQLVAPFVKAAFALPKAGAVSPPAKTDYGWHVIYFAEEFPAEDRSFEQARDTIAGEALPQVREAKAAEIMEKLRARQNIFVFENSLAVGDTGQ